MSSGKVNGVNLPGSVAGNYTTVSGFLAVVIGTIILVWSTRQAVRAAATVRTLSRVVQ